MIWSDKIRRFNFSVDGTLMLQAFNVFRQLAVLIGSVLIARSTLSLYDIGVFESLIFFGFVVNVFWYNGLFTAFLKVGGDISDFSKKHISTSFFTVLIISSFLAIFSFIFKDFILFILNLEIWKWEYNFFLGYMALQPAIYFAQGVFLIEKKIAKGLWLTFAYFTIYILVFGAHFYFSFTLEELLWYMMIMSIVQLIFACFLLFPSLVFQGLDQLWLTKWLDFAKPLLIYSSLGSLSFIFDNWLVNWYYEDKSVYALFRYGARELPLVQTFIVSLGVAMVYKISFDLNTGLEELKKKSNDILKWLVPLLFILVMSSPYLFSTILGEKFKESAFVFNIYLILLLSRVIYSHTVIIAIGKPKWLNYGLLVELLVNFALSFLLIQYFGVIGVAIATLIAFFIEKIFFVFFLKYKLQISAKRYLPSNYYILSIVLICLANLLIYYQLN